MVKIDLSFVHEESEIERTNEINHMQGKYLEMYRLTMVEKVTWWSW